MREIFSKKTFWAILVILLLAVFVYPPSLTHQTYDNTYYRGWELFFLSNRPVDLKMLLVEIIIAISLAIGICLIPFHEGNKKKIN
jgi:hypothetical protein